MKLLHQMVLRMLPGPFFGTLGTLMFLLLMQFLMKRLPDLVGKGLGPGIIFEIIIYNLAYMLVLAVPMAVLLTTIAVFGRLSESGAYVVMKNAGISLPQLIWPTALIALFVTMGMTYFNNEVLPESNYRARALWHDIRNKKPGFALQPGIFYDGLKGYSIRAMEIPPTSNELLGVTIFDYTEGNQRKATIAAGRGVLAPRPDGQALDLILEDGERHLLSGGTDDRYERIRFARTKLTFDLSDLAFERSDPESISRSDRTTRTATMIRLVDSLEANIIERQEGLLLSMQRFERAEDAEGLTASVLSDTTALDTLTLPWALADLPQAMHGDVYERAIQNVRALRTEIDNTRSGTRWAARRADRYRVEIHKKYSIAFACLLFMLIGAPLGLRIKRGGLGVVSGLSVGIFLFYWVTLVQGEKLADRGLLEPWIGMWAANLGIGLGALFMLGYVAFDLRNRRWFRRKPKDG